MMRILLAFNFLFCVLAAKEGFGQNRQQHYLDSVLMIANKNELDSNSVNALTNLQRYYFERGLYDSTLKYAKRAFAIARDLGNEKSFARIHYNLGMTYTNLIQYDSAEFYLNAVEKFMPIIKDTALQVNGYNAMSLLNSYRSDNDGAIEYAMKSAVLIDQSSSPKLKQLLPQTYGNIAYYLLGEKQFEKAIEYGKKGLILKNYPNENRQRVLICLTVSEGYTKLKKPVEAKVYLDSAILINRPLNNLVLNSIVFSNEGYYYESINDSRNALSAFIKAFELCDSIGNDFLKAEAGDNIAQLYFKTKKYSEAEKFAKESNDIGKRLKEYKVVASTYDVLKKVASQKGDFKKALNYAELNKLYADSATNNETQHITLSLESKYQNKKKEKEIASLTLTNTEKHLAVVKRDRYLVLGGLVASSLLIILGLLYRNSKNKQAIAEKEQKLQQEQIKFLERQQQVVSLQSMINGQEVERTRIARDLHDGLGGLFSTVKMHFSALQHDVPELKTHSLFEKSYSLVDSASVELRRIAHSMMPEVLMKLGLVNALKDLCDNISAGKLIRVSLEVHGINDRLNANTEIMLYRIIQELLNNIMKHAQASEVIIQFIKDEHRLSVVVEDNGQGFNTRLADDKKHAGLEAVKSRVDYLNGNLTIDSERGVGTTVMMDFLINE